MRQISSRQLTTPLALLVVLIGTIWRFVAQLFPRYAVAAEALVLLIATFRLHMRQQTERYSENEKQTLSSLHDDVLERRNFGTCKQIPAFSRLKFDDSLTQVDEFPPLKDKQIFYK